MSQKSSSKGSKTKGFTTWVIGLKRSVATVGGLAGGLIVSSLITQLPLSMAGEVKSNKLLDVSVKVSSWLPALGATVSAGVDQSNGKLMQASIDSPFYDPTYTYSELTSNGITPYFGNAFPYNPMKFQTLPGFDQVSGGKMQIIMHLSDKLGGRCKVLPFEGVGLVGKSTGRKFFALKSEELMGGRYAKELIIFAPQQRGGKYGVEGLSLIDDAGRTHSLNLTSLEEAPCP